MTPQCPDGVELRAATTADAAAIAAVLGAAFVEHRADYTDQAYESTVIDPARVTDRLAEGPTWVATRGGGILGTVSAVPRGGQLYIRSLAVHPDARGLGIGELLIIEATDWAIDSGFDSLRLETTPFLETSQRLYLRCGFTYDGITRGDLHGTPLVAMVRQLGGG